MYREEHESKSFDSDIDQRVVLNVGGRIFETFTSTLANLPGSLLEVMFNSRNASMLKKKKNEDFFFFDRCIKHDNLYFNKLFSSQS